MLIYDSPNIGLLYNEKQYSHTMQYCHFHPDYELYYLLQGTRHVFYRGESHLMVSGNFCYVNGEEMHRFSAEGNQPYKRIILYIKKASFRREWEPWRAMLEEGGYITSGSAELKKIKVVMDAILEECLHPCSDTEPYIAGLVQQLLVLISRAAVLKRSSETYAADWLANLLAYLENHYMEPVSVPQLAQLSCLSVSHFTRSFKSCTGYTVLGYITSLRMMRAAELLRTSHAAVSQVGIQVGCATPSHFDKLFRRAYGMSPKEYRKKYKS